MVEDLCDGDKDSMLSLAGTPKKAEFLWTIREILKNPDLGSGGSGWPFFCKFSVLNSPKAPNNYSASFLD